MIKIIKIMKSKQNISIKTTKTWNRIGVSILGHNCHSKTDSNNSRKLFKTILKLDSIKMTLSLIIFQ